MSDADLELVESRLNETGGVGYPSVDDEEMYS